jgi:hypothetical protein
VFGCGFDNRNIVFGGNIGPNNVIAGIFGLGSGRRSILRQLGNATNLRFSYCLPSWRTPQGTYTYLHFGPDAQIRGDAQRIVQTTPMLPGIPRYYVNMLGISIDAARLPIDQTVFKLKDDGICLSQKFIRVCLKLCLRNKAFKLYIKFFLLFFFFFFFFLQKLHF